MSNTKIINIILKCNDINKLNFIGIYFITHDLLSNSILYVGSTAIGVNKDINSYHKGFYKRFYDHCYSLLKNKHHNKHLQNIVNKYGIEGITFHIHSCFNNITRKELYSKEQDAIICLKPRCNVFSTVFPVGREWSEEDKTKASIRLKGKALPKSFYERISKKLYQYDLKGNLVRTFNSIREAAQNTNIDGASISKCASGYRYLAGTFIWSFTKNKPIVKKPTYYILQSTLDDIPIALFKSISEITKYLKINTTTAIRNCIIGKQHKAYNYKWKKINPEIAKDLGLFEDRLTVDDNEKI